MPVSLVKIPVAASNAAGVAVRLGAIPVRVTSVEPYAADPGKVVLVGLTLNGAQVAKVLPAGFALAPVPAWVFRHAATDRPRTVSQ